MVVVGVIALLAGVVFPSVSSGIDTIRLSTAADSVASFLSGALNRAEQRQRPVMVSISAAEHAITMESDEPVFQKRLELPDGVRIEAVLPAVESEEPGPRRFMLLPGGVVPRIGIELANRRNAKRIVRVDPITGVPSIERPQEAE